MSNNGVDINNAIEPIVWIVDDDASIRWVIEAALEDKPYLIKVFDANNKFIGHQKLVKQ